jgi:tartrate dehydrogenase/decarboxylase/D-malate dehydrogenase
LDILILVEDGFGRLIRVESNWWGTTDPESIDTVVATNLHADVLSDLAAALSGSLGVAPTGNINPERVAPSMFEPIHGSAFDIMGHGSANPLGSFWSASLMLDHLGESEAAAELFRAIETVTGEGSALPRDLGGQAGTDDVTEAVCKAL